jgi:LPXTG-site transpeptidase (sortase) family protein
MIILSHLFSYLRLLRWHRSLLVAAVMSLLVASRAFAAEPAPGALLTIPALDLSAAVVTIPLDASIGTWNTASLGFDVGHFEYTPWVGEGGNIVLGGHHTLADGTPSVFYNLADISRGDTIEVMQGGVTEVYEVTRIRDVAISDLSVLTTGSDTITLMTCAGYNDDTGNYDRRLVVIATRVG